MQRQRGSGEPRGPTGTCLLLLHPLGCRASVSPSDARTVRDRLRNIKKFKSLFEQINCCRFQLAASNLGDRKELRGAAQDERVLGRREREQESHVRPQSGLVIANLLSFRGWQGSLRKITLTSVDQAFSDVWFKIPFLGETKL